MNCTDAKQLIHPYLDKELDAANATQVEQHLRNCGPCQHELNELRELGSLIKDQLPRKKAPDSLRTSILAGLEKEQLVKVVNPSILRLSWLPKSIALAASVLLAVFAVVSFNQHQSETALIENMLSGHVSAISAERLTDISSHDIAKLAPWFTSRLDYSPRIYDFNRDGFELLGGRLDTLQNQRIASVTYLHQDHVVNLYTWPSPDVDDAEQEMHSLQGYHLLYWCQNKMNYWIVSDMDAKGLKQLAALQQKRVSPAFK